MFKSWKSDKGKNKAVFKLQFQATQVPLVGWDSLAVSLISLDIGRPTVKSEKVAVRDGFCKWDNPIYETVRLSRDSKTGRFSERLYKFVVFSGSSKGGVLGEAVIDFADYIDSFRPSSKGLPLRSTNSSTVLHVTIQRLQIDVDGREEANGEELTKHNGRTLKSQLSSEDLEETMRYNDGFHEDNPSRSQGKMAFITADSNGTKRELGGSGGMSVSSLDSVSEHSTPKENGRKGSSLRQDATSFLSSLSNSASTLNQTAHWRLNTELSVSSGPDEGQDDSSSSSDSYLMKENSQDSDILVENLKKDIAVLSRQVEVSELEIQSLRKQVVKDSRRGQDLSREVNCLREERDALKRECEQLKASDEKDKMPTGSGNLQYIVEELRKELNYEKDLNADLRSQLQKTQDSNCELILAVQDLEEMLEQRNIDTSANNEENPAIEGDKVHDDIKSSQAAKLEVDELYHQIKACEKEKEALEISLKQFSVNYETLKEENEELSTKLKQNVKDQRRFQHKNEASLAFIEELKLQIQSLETEMKSQEVAYGNNLEEVIRERMEHEQRAIQAEDSLRKMKLNNANTAERLQEEFRRLSAQMSSTFEVNEKLAMQAQTEANELRVQKFNLESLLDKFKEELDLVKDQNAKRIEEMTEKMDLKEKELDSLVLELDEKNQEVEHWKTYVEEREKNLQDEINSLNSKVDLLDGEKNDLIKVISQKEALMNDTLRRLELVKEKNSTLLEKARTNESALKELNGIKQIKDEKEAELLIMQKEMDALRSEHNNVKHSLLEDKQEKEKLGKQVLQLKSEICKKDDEIAVLEKKLKDAMSKATNAEVSVKIAKKNNKSSPPSRGSKDVPTMREKIKLLEGEIKLKEAALEKAAQSSIEKEKEFKNKVDELKKDMLELNQKLHSMDAKDSKKEEHIDVTDDGSKNLKQSGSSNPLIDSEMKNASDSPGSNVDSNELLAEIGLLKEQNKAMEVELKEMSERYSEISLKFAEVEGERQQLVMAIRNLKNAKKS